MSDNPALPLRRAALRDAVARILSRVRTGGADIAITAGFVAVFATGIVHHEMWGDEYLAWLIARTSDGPLALFRALHYDGHPGLWHALLWPFAHLTANPAAMKLPHAAIAIALIALIGLRSPFSRLERVLLLGGYFVAFEYTVISRNYGIGMLLALLYADSRARRPERVIGNGALLGLLANTNVFAGFLAGALGLEYLADRIAARTPPMRLAAGAALALGGLALAVATVWPAPDISHEITRPLAMAVSPGHFLKTALRFLDLAFIPVRVEPLAPQFALYAARPAEIVSLWPELAVAAALLAALAAIFRPAPRLLGVFGLTALGATAFGHLVYATSARHWGIVFVAFVACAWMLRIRAPAAAPRLLALLLAFGTLGGAQAMVLQWSMPFSAVGATVRWMDANRLGGASVIVVPDVLAHSIAARLARPVTMLECRCTAPRPVFSRARDGFRREELAERLAEAVADLPGGEAIVVSGWGFTDADRDRLARSGLAPVLLHTEDEGWMEHALRVYRIARSAAPLTPAPSTLSRR